MKLLKDTDILIKPKPQKADDKNQKEKEKKENNEEQKQPVAAVKFEENDAMDAIAKLECFDSDQMDYVDYLEALVRIAIAYPFTEEQLTELQNFEDKMEFLLQRLDAKFKEQHKAFEKKMMNPNVEEMKFQPRVVVDEDDEDEFMDN